MKAVSSIAKLVDKMSPCPVHGSRPLIWMINTSYRAWCSSDTCLDVRDPNPVRLVKLWNAEVQFHPATEEKRRAEEARTGFVAVELTPVGSGWRIDLPCGHSLMRMVKKRPTLESPFVVKHLRRCSILCEESLYGAEREFEDSRFDETNPGEGE